MKKTTQQKLRSLIERIIREESSGVWTIQHGDGSAQLKNPHGSGYYIIHADENNVFQYEIKLDTGSDIKRIYTNIDGESRLNLKLKSMDLPEINASKLHSSVSNWYDSLDDMEDSYDEKY